MKKYELHTNKEKAPSDEVINKHKNFVKLYGDYKKMTTRPKKPLYKNPAYFLFLLLIILITYIIYTGIEK